jgi:DNA-binding FadR family transcriptional regulator
VVDAIASREAKAAREAMRAHLGAALIRYRAHH